jgi:hypothetical protein
VMSWEELIMVDGVEVLWGSERISRSSNRE